MEELGTDGKKVKIAGSSYLHHLSLAHIYQNHKRRKENGYTD
jgi:hypothetical protein